MANTTELKAQERLKKIEPPKGALWRDWAIYRLVEELERYRAANPHIRSVQNISETLNSTPSPGYIFQPCTVSRIQNLLYQNHATRLPIDLVLEMHLKLDLDMNYILFGVREKE